MKETVFAFISGICIGGGFGFALEKSKVYLPVVIRQQMKLQNFTMMKLFLMSMAVGTLCLIVAEILNLGKRKPKAPVHLGVDFLGRYGGNIVGGVLLGVGMTIAGACPGTLAVQLGSNVQNAVYAYVGGLVGVTIFGLLENILRSRLPSFGKQSKPILISETIGLGNWTVSLMFVIIFGSVALLLERYQPSNSQWSAISCGVLIGLLQLPSLIFGGSHLGTSSSYCTIVGSCIKVVDPDAEKHAPYFSKFLSKDGVFQVGLISGMVISGYLSSYGSNLNLVTGISKSTSFFGSAIMLFGARLGDGCTSGHGISGVATLSLASIISVICMFAGAMSTALFL